MDDIEIKTFKFEVKEFGELSEEKKGTFVGTASVYDALDLHGEIIDSGAFEYDGYAPILWQHLPHEVIGSVQQLENEPKSVLVGAELDLKVQRGFETYSLLKNRHVRGLSVGFITTQDSYVDGVRHIQKAKLMEVSITAFPAQPLALIDNVKALETEVKGGRKLSGTTIQTIRNAITALQELIGDVAPPDEEPKTNPPTELKSAIPYKKTPLADPDTPWDGPEQMRLADSVEVLRAICAWVDIEKPDVKQSYKLPHHLAEGEHACVWNGVRNALARLGGTDIPAGDVAAVRAHLEKHRADFGKEGDSLFDESERKSFNDYFEKLDKLLTF